MMTHVGNTEALRDVLGEAGEGQAMPFGHVNLKTHLPKTPDCV